MLKFILSNDNQEIDKQIQALQWQISNDTNKNDLAIHKKALEDLKKHEEKIKVGD